MDQLDDVDINIRDAIEELGFDFREIIDLIEKMDVSVKADANDNEGKQPKLVD